MNSAIRSITVKTRNNPEMVFTVGENGVTIIDRVVLTLKEGVAVWKSTPDNARHYVAFEFSKDTIIAVENIYTKD